MAASCLLLGEPGELPGHLSAALAGEGFATVPVADADAFRSGARSGRYALGFVPQAQTLEVHGLCAACVESAGD